MNFSLKLIIKLWVVCGATVSALALCSEDPGSNLGGGKFLGSGNGEAATWC